MDDIRFLVDFSEEVAEVETPDDTTVADLAIWAGNDCLTRNRPRRPRLSGSSDTVYGPIGGIADWLIENWGPIAWEMHTPFQKNRIGTPNSNGPVLPGVAEAYRNWHGYLDEDADTSDVDAQDLSAFADWHHRHLIGHASSDLALPSIVILPEDRNVVLCVDKLPSMMQASVEFLGPDGQDRSPTLIVCTKTAFQEQARELIEATIQRANSVPKFIRWAEWLRERWETAQMEEGDPKRRLDWMLGDIGAERVKEIRERDHQLATGLTSLLADCKLPTSKTDLDPLENLVQEYALKRDSVLTKGEQPGWQGVAQESISNVLPEFAQGYQLARLVRRKLGIGTKPISDLGKTFKRLDVEIEDDCPTPLFRVAVCAGQGKRAHIIPSSLDKRMASQSAVRFAETSSLGRLLWQSRRGGTRLVCAAQGDQAMLSQSRRANAFAAEFLMPREAVEGVQSGDNYTISRLADRYGISQKAATWHVYNVANDPDHFWQ